MILLLPTILLSLTTGFASPPIPPKINPGTNLSHETLRIKRSQEILRALFLEHRHRYNEARKIWETLPQANESVIDHIFQTDLMDQKPLFLETIPTTKSSILFVVSYLKWQKKWDNAYQLLKNHPAMVAKYEDLRLIEVTLALYLRKYKEAELLLLEMAPHNILDKIRLRQLWSWYYVLSGRKYGLRTAIEELEENTLYLPASIVVTEHLGFRWTETKKRALRALTRFPSNSELIEEIVIVFQNHGAWKEIGRIIAAKKNSPSATDWIIAANVYLQTGQDHKLKQLLNNVPETERHRIEFLDYAARFAVRRKEWGQLKRVSDQVRKHYPYLRDGDLFLAEYNRRTGNSEK
ncbi:MAG: hypothetical protein HN745_08825 [Deltaproteobacteria bacterium]|nr:hypothetical protein [Deltaproteobacteria bacterium]MBT7711812.1 hypothetical protein [Deltaproteobacteria bacterium]